MLDEYQMNEIRAEHDKIDDAISLGCKECSLKSDMHKHGYLDIIEMCHEDVKPACWPLKDIMESARRIERLKQF
jgi:hypothetical protein